MRGQQPWRTIRARTLRDNETAAEAKLWSELRDRRLGGHKFVRQAAIGPYYVDFVCRACRVIVEIDGATHSTDAERAADEARSAGLERLGYRIFRAGNDDVYEHLERMFDALLASLYPTHDLPNARPGFLDPTDAPGPSRRPCDGRYQIASAVDNMSQALKGAIERHGPHPIGTGHATQDAPRFGAGLAQPSQ